METMPQVITVISLLVTEYINDFGHLKTIFMERIVQGSGVNAPSLCAVIIIINLLKISLVALSLEQLHKYPMGMGILG